MQSETGGLAIGSSVPPRSRNVLAVVAAQQITLPPHWLAAAVEPRPLVEIGSARCDSRIAPLLKGHSFADVFGFLKREGALRWLRLTTSLGTIQTRDSLDKLIEIKFASGALAFVQQHLVVSINLASSTA